jgi:hypothetical protein
VTTSTTPSTARSIALATAVAGAGAAVVNTVISLVAQALGADPAVHLGLQPVPYILFGVVGVLVAALAWVAIGRRAERPSAVMRWLVPVVVLVSLIPNVASGFTLGWDGAIALGLMHVAVAAVAVPVFHRFLPLPR